MNYHFYNLYRQMNSIHMKRKFCYCLMFIASPQKVLTQNVLVKKSNCQLFWNFQFNQLYSP